MRKVLAAALMAAVASPVAAMDLTRTSEGYTYFNKAGADMAAHNAEILDCKEKVKGMYQPAVNVVVTGGGLAGAIGGAIAAGIIQATNNHTGRMVNIENCMVVKGWRVVSLDSTEGPKVAKLDQKAKAAQIAEWVGAAEPHGTVVRVFNNDVSTNLSTGLYAAARHQASTALSTDAVIADKGKKDDTPKTPAPTMPKTAKPPEPLKAADLGGVPAGSALIVANMKGVGAASLVFNRVGPDAATPAWVDGKPAAFFVAQPRKASATAGGAQGTTLAYAVPPGRWRLAAVTSGEFTISFCMGAPAFDVAEGDVVYAGAFDPTTAGQAIGPDMNLEPAKAAFPALSNLGDKVKPAAWINGTTSQCGGTYLYALELPDRGFAEGYGLGSKAKPASAMTAAPAPAAAPAATVPASAPAAAAPAAAPTPTPTPGH